MARTYQDAQPNLTVDCVVFGLDVEQKDLKILLIQRDKAPFQGGWALPGGFVRVNESLEHTAMRELREETGMSEVFLEQLYTFGAVERDSRERVVTVAYYALVNLNGHQIQASSDARHAAWFSVQDMPTLAFDHDHVVAVALRRLQGKVRYEPIGFELLPKKFTVSQLHTLYEIVLERQLDRRNFRKKILSMGLLTDLREAQEDVAHRAARLYQFNEKKYHQLKRRGFHFEI